MFQFMALYTATFEFPIETCSNVECHSLDRAVFDVLLLLFTRTDCNAVARIQEI
jgi:hypothetical protein